MAMKKMSVVELKAMLHKAESGNEEHVIISTSPQTGDANRPRSDSTSTSNTVANTSLNHNRAKSIARMTKELTSLYRRTIQHTSDGKLDAEDIKELVSAFAGATPTDEQMSNIMVELDEDGDGDVSEEEWVSFGLSHMSESDGLDHIGSVDLEDESMGLISNTRKNSNYITQFCYWWMSIDWDEVYWNAKDGIVWFLDSCKISFSFGDLMMVMTLFVLFGDNIKLLSTTKEADAGFEICNTICLFFFIAEFLAQWWAKTDWESIVPFKFEGYFLSFYFWLDFVSILSMFPDISWIAVGLGIGDISQSVSGNNNITRAGRIIRLVRLVRLVRLYKIYLEKRRKMDQEAEMLELMRANVMSYDEILRQQALYQDRQSKLGSKLNHSITQRVILLVLSMVIILPLTTYSESNYACYGAVDSLYTFVDGAVGSSTMQTALVNEVTSEFSSANEHVNPVLLYLSMEPYDSSAPLINNTVDREILRSSAILKVSRGVKGSGTYIEAEFGINSLLKETAELNIGLTIFIGMILVVGSAIFNNDAQDTVLSPIERMMNMVDAVVKDPLSPLHFDHSGPVQAGEYETRLLESTVEKITGLLRVGFGEAGAGIISANLSLDSGSKINPLLPGVRVYVIVGFCDIHHFEEVLVKLTDDVLTFVNTIAEIVHENVAHWGGQCNKNLGNAFVILWRIDDENTLRDTLSTSKFSKKVTSGPGGQDSGKGKESTSKKETATKVIDLKRVPGINIYADQALIGYLKIIAEINRSKAILKYRNEPRLTSNGTEAFKVGMGFGLHAGWAIEGAVGSMYKVDATYLSPHVNMAARLETSSRQYGVPLLVSHFVHELLSHEVKQKCRLIDVVTVKGSEVPVGVYTYDCLQDQVFKSKPTTQLTKKDAEAKKLQMANEGDTGLDKILTSSAITAKVIASDVWDKGKSNYQSQAPLDIDFLDGFMSTLNQAENMKSAVNAKKRGGNQSASNLNTSATPDEEVVEGFFLNNTHDTVEVFDMDDDMLMLRAHVKGCDEFNTTFSEGIKIYLDGDWANARKFLEKANKIMARIAPVLGGDGPCLTLLNYMEERNWTAPSDWAGFRPLTAK